jgi:hypothetical protein
MALASPAPGLPEAGQPLFVRATIEAVAKRDAAFLQYMFKRIEELKDDSSHSVGAGEVIDLLAGCEPGAVRVMEGEVYIVDYRCPKRRAEAAGCHTGDLSLFLSDTLAVSHRRHVSDACPLFVPG